MGRRVGAGAMVVIEGGPGDGIGEREGDLNG